MSSASSNKDVVDDPYDDDSTTSLLRYEQSASVQTVDLTTEIMVHSIEKVRMDTALSPPIDATSPPFQKSYIALRLLNDARLYAEKLGRFSWDFAEEIDSLWQHGLTNGELRWLVCAGLVEHAREITERGQSERKFVPDRGLSFSNQTCFVLSDRGVAHESLRVIGHADEPCDEPDESPTPVWDHERQQLRVGKAIVKQYKVPAPNQETILATFQEADWPDVIDDPLPPHSEIEPKRRLYDTIKSLNRNQKRTLIRFRMHGSGEEIRWDLVKTSEPGP